MAGIRCAIPVGSSRWTARNEINERTRPQVARLVEESTAAPPGSEARKVADFRAAWLDEDAIDAQGMAPLWRMLERIGGVRDKTALTQLLGSGMRADVDPLNAGVYDSASVPGLSVETGNLGEDGYVAFLLQGGLGLPQPRSLIQFRPASCRRPARGTRPTSRACSISWASIAARRAAAVVALETEIARSHATPEASGDDGNAANLWTREDFARRAPGLDWNAFFTAAATFPAIGLRRLAAGGGRGPGRS